MTPSNETTRAGTLRSNRRRVLGTANPGAIAFFVLLILAAFAFGWGWLSAPPNRAFDVLNVGGALCIGVATSVLGATTGVVGDERGFIDVVGYFVVTRIPVSDIAVVTVDRGLRVITSTGRRVGTTAYGHSTTGEKLGYPRSRSACGRIEAFIHDVGAGASIRAGLDDVRRSPRWAAYASALTLCGLLIGGALLLNKLRWG
jgi:hypothetical protein